MISNQLRVKGSGSEAGERRWPVTPRLRAAIVAAATVIGLANMILPLVSRYEAEGGVAVAVIGLYGVALGVPEVRRAAKRRRRDEDEGDD